MGPLTEEGPVRFGLDIGGTKTLGVVLNEQDRILARVHRPTKRGVDGVIDTATTVVRELAHGAARVPTHLGVGVPGLVDADAGTVSHAVNLDVNGRALPIAKLLNESIGVPVAVGNDANVAALGAARHCGHRDLAFLSIGTGLAAGLVLDGRLRPGGHGAAGEIGHIPVDPRGRECRCGQRGCLETIASGSALGAAWPKERGASADAFAAAEAGEPEAIDVIQRFSTGVAHAIRLLSLVVDTDVIMVGGGVSRVGKPLLTAVAAAMRAQSADSAFLGSLNVEQRVRLAPPDYPIAAVGAAMLGTHNASHSKGAGSPAPTRTISG